MVGFVERARYSDVNRRARRRDVASYLRYYAEECLTGRSGPKHQNAASVFVLGTHQVSAVPL